MDHYVGGGLVCRMGAAVGILFLLEILDTRLAISDFPSGTGKPRSPPT